MDYKDTLNLPQTGFPMRANLAQREPETLARWDAAGLYRKMVERRAGRPTSSCTTALRTQTGTFTSATR